MAWTASSRMFLCQPDVVTTTGGAANPEVRRYITDLVMVASGTTLQLTKHITIEREAGGGMRGDDDNSGDDENAT